MTTITITVDATGNMTTKVNGIKGKSCTDATKFLRDLGTVASEKKTTEYYEGEVKKTNTNGRA